MKIKAHTVKVVVSVEEREYDNVYQVKSVKDYKNGDALFYQEFLHGEFLDYYCEVTSPALFISQVDFDHQRVFASSSSPLVLAAGVETSSKWIKPLPFSLNRLIERALKIITENKKP